MTVQELINMLNNVDDKSMKVLQDNFEDVYNIEVTEDNVILRSW